MYRIPERAVDRLAIKVCPGGATENSPGQSEAPPWVRAGLGVAPWKGRGERRRFLPLQHVPRPFHE